MAEENNPAVSESDSFGWVGEFWRDVRPIEWPVIVGNAVTRRRFVTQIDPSLGGATSPVARDLLLWCTPSQPYGVHRHSWANLPLTHQSLVPRREMLVKFRVLRDARPGRSTTGKKQRGNCYRECQRDAFEFGSLFKNLAEILKTPVGHWLGASLTWFV